MLDSLKMEAHRIEFKKESGVEYAIVPMLVGCIDYVFGDKPFHGQTGFIYQVDVFDRSKDRVRNYAIRIGSDVPKSKLVLTKYVFGGDFAN